MNNKTIILLLVGALTLAGCKSTTAPKAEPKPEPVVQKASPAPAPVLSQTAADALKQAKSEVAAARAVKSLWVTAEDALKKAEEASLKADSDATIKFSKIAIEQAQLGQAQTKYPPLK